MKFIFDKTIWDASELSEVFPDKQLLRFLNRYQGIRSKSITKAIEQSRDKIGDGDLIESVFKHFYPNDMVIVDDLYAICLQAAVNRRCHFRFVPYRVRVIQTSAGTTSGNKRKGIRIKGRKVAFVGGTGSYTKEEARKAIKKLGGENTTLKQAELVIVGQRKLTSQQRFQDGQETVDLDYLEARFDKTLKQK
jgi:hypothetical protein